MALGFACALLSPLRVSAQPTTDPRASGTTYVFAFPDTISNKYDSRQDTDPRFTKREPQQDSVYICVYSPVANTVQVTGYGGYANKLTMRAGEFKVVWLNGSPRASAPIVTDVGSVTGKTFRIEAVSPVVVYCFMGTRFGTEAFTPIPVESWGKDHYVSTWPGEVLYDEIPGGENNYGKTPKAGPAEILVVAAFDNTRVTIVPNARLNNNPPTTVTLMKDQCYQVQSYVDTSAFNAGNPQPDIGGSYVFATKPIGVISGNTRSQVLDNAAGLAKNSFKNMMIEWITPTEQHGTQFAYLPTWDDNRITGAPGENPDWKRQGEVVRVFATAGSSTDVTPTITEGVDIEGLSGNVLKTYDIPRTKFYETLIGAAVPHVFKTDQPAEAFMVTTAVVKFNGTTGSAGFVGSSYNGVATYMVEMTPREQWTYVAPYYAAEHPPKMNHFMNIVTDANSRNKIQIKGQQFIINRQIAGTDLWWGTRTLNKGEMGLVQGADTSCKFYAFVYGNMQGMEVYRPGKTKKQGDGGETAGATDRRDSKSNNQVLHPSEYEENIGFMYGYPLAPSRLVLRPSDSLLIDTTYLCGVLTVKIRTLNANPVGLRTITLDPDSTVNARLNFVDPAPPEPVIGLTKAEVNVTPIDPSKNAHGIVVIQDRTGKTWKVYYNYIAEYVTVNPAAGVDFGQVTLNSRQTKTITIINPLSKPISIDTLFLMIGTQNFTVISTKPPISTDPNNRTMIAPGDSIVVTVEVNPTIQNKLYQDTLRVKFGCTDVKVPLQAETVQPCLYVDDLKFGTLSPGESKTLPLKICNTGRGVVTFNDPWLTWIKTEFSVPASDIDKLKTAALGPGDCVTINVTFTSSKTGVFRDVARFWANTRDCRDTSVWTATVTKPGPFISGHDWGKVWVTTLNSCTKDLDSEYTWVIYALNTGDKDFTVEKIELIGKDADDGYFRLDNTFSDTTIKSGDLIKQGDTNQYRPLQRVIFKPKDERSYDCIVRLTTTTGDVVESVLQGIGIESHVAITGFDFGKWEFIAPNNPTVPGTVSLTAPKSTRDLTVTGLVLDDPNNFSITGLARADGTVIPLTTPFTPFTMVSDEVVKVSVQFNPQSAKPTLDTTKIRVLGDFAFCPDDSTNVLRGTVYTVGATTTGDALPAILTCYQDTAYVTLSNNGSAPIILTGVTLSNNPGNQFELLFPTLPDTLAGTGEPGSSIKIPVIFRPQQPGDYTATVGFQVRKIDKDVPVDGVNDVNVTASAFVVKTTASIKRDYRAYPGTKLVIPIMMDDNGAAVSTAVDNARIQELLISFTYDPGMMLLDNGGDAASLLQGTLLQNWSIKPGTLQTTPAGTFQAVFVANTPADYLQGPFGDSPSLPLLKPRFVTYLGNVDSTDINLSVVPDNLTKCVTIDTKYGHAQIDSVCGLNFRLIQMTSSKYSLSQNKPNPFNPSTDIEFSVGLDGQTSLVIYNELGQKVATLVDQYLQPGSYKVTWDASTFPSGLYYYRLTSNVWSRTNTMILNK